MLSFLLDPTSIAIAGLVGLTVKVFFGTFFALSMRRTDAQQAIRPTVTRVF